MNNKDEVISEAAHLWRRALMATKGKSTSLVLGLYTDLGAYLGNPKGNDNILSSLRVMEEGDKEGQDRSNISVWIIGNYWNSCSRHWQAYDCCTRLLNLFAPSSENNDLIILLMSSFNTKDVNPEAMRAVIDHVQRVHRLVPDNVKDKIFISSVSMAYNGNRAGADCFQMLVNQYGIEDLNDVMARGNKTLVSYFLRDVQAIECAQRMDRVFEASAEQVDACARLLEVMISCGVDIEVGVRGADHGLEFNPVSILHLACTEEFHNDQDNFCSVGIASLIRAGADWQKVLDAGEGVDPSARTLIENDPLVRRQRLIEIARATPGSP